MNRTPPHVPMQPQSQGLCWVCTAVCVVNRLLHDHHPLTTSVRALSAARRIRAPRRRSSPQAQHLRAVATSIRGQLDVLCALNPRFHRKPLARMDIPFEYAVVCLLRAVGRRVCYVAFERNQSTESFSDGDPNAFVYSEYDDAAFSNLRRLVWPHRKCIDAIELGVMTGLEADASYLHSMIVVLHEEAWVLLDPHVGIPTAVVPTPFAQSIEHLLQRLDVRHPRLAIERDGDDELPSLSGACVCRTVEA